jgi:type II secretory pathway component PulJ
MVFKATCIKRSCRGFTIAESLIGLALGVLLAGVVMGFAVYNGRSFAALTNWMELQQGNRSAMDQITRDVRQVLAVTAYNTNSVTFLDYDGKSLLLAYDPVKKTLTRTKNGASKILLRECDSFEFFLMQRNIIEGSYTYYPAEEIETCKVLGLKWSCSRTILGKKSQLTEDQSIDIVIRKI